MEGADPNSRPPVVLFDLRCELVKDLRDAAAADGIRPDDAARYRLGGASGSPVFIKGKLAGIILGHYENLAYNSLSAVPVEHFRRPYCQWPLQWTYIAAVLAVIGILVALISEKRRRDEVQCQKPFIAVQDKQRDVWQKPDEIIKLLEVVKDNHVADIGTGSGYFLSFLWCAVGPNGKVYAIDVQPDMIRRLEKLTLGTKVEPKLAREDDPELPEGQVDRVLIVNTWHQIEKPEVYASALARALRTDGVVLIADYTMEAKQGPPQKKRVTPKKVVDDLSANGLFDATVVDESLDQQFVVIGRCRDKCGH